MIKNNKEYDKKYKNKIRAYRKANHLCYSCGDKLPIDEKRINCSFCRAKQKQYDKANKNACGYHNCDTCPFEDCKANMKIQEMRREKNNKNKRKYYYKKKIEWANQNKCSSCGDILPINSEFKQCLNCRERKKISAKKHREKYPYVKKIFNENLCHLCHKKPIVEGYNTCSDCLEICRKRIKNCLKTTGKNNYFGKLNDYFWKNKGVNYAC